MPERGLNWADPKYDAAGNMITGQYTNLIWSFDYQYDAWNRMVAGFLPLVSSTIPLTQYEYDGLNRLNVRQLDNDYDGTANEVRHFYYNQQWQVLEEQAGSTASSARPDVQYVWGVQYVDDLIVRYRDADASGTSGSPCSAPASRASLWAIARSRRGAP